MCVFPPNNLVSPVAEALKKKLINVNWARTGLDLPLVSTQKLTLYNLVVIVPFSVF